MTKYEQILSKISPTFYKFFNYRRHFKDKASLVFLYLHKINFSPEGHYFAPDIPMIEIPIKTFTYILELFNWLTLSLPAIALYESYRKDRYTKGNYIEFTYDEAIINLVINNFSFENLNIIDSPNTFKDLFIALMGVDIYETIRENIR